ncbi:MAG: hypothetical protein HY749_11775 [Gammaproteobacteria bacterium]|nr:hypothetical protein [Gammaproteobacteria bacterium]MBI5616253.1 hypothetical protein [Gammaproteobacteria bacterium]
MNDRGAAPGFEFARDEALADIPVGFLVLRGFDGTAFDPQFNEVRTAYLAELLATTTLEDVLADSRLAGYQALHAAIGRTGRQFTPSPESLFRVLFKRGAPLPSILPLVDLYNHCALGRRISIGAHDLATLTPPVRLARFAAPARFLPMGETKEITVGAGEYGYVDGAGRVLCRLECRQAEHSKLTAATREPLLVIQGHAALGIEEIAAAAAELEALVARWCGGGVRAELTLLA